MNWTFNNLGIKINNNKDSNICKAWIQSLTNLILVSVHLSWTWVGLDFQVADFAKFQYFRCY